MPTLSLTFLEYALLGLVDMTPMSGYDLHRLFATTPMAHLSSSPGAIYPALRRLERRGLLRKKLEGGSEARPRRVFSSTRAGQVVLQAWLRQQVTREELIRNTGAPLLRFALGGTHLSTEEAMAYLEAWRSEIERYLPELRQYHASMNRGAALHGWLALERGIRAFEEDIAWIKDSLARLRAAARASRRAGAANLVQERKRR